MKVLVFGALGKTGKAVVERAVIAGHEVTAFVRISDGANALNVIVANGDATNRSDVDAAMRGQQAVIDTIGGKTPWKHTTLEATAAGTIVASMKANGVRRLLVTSMLGVGDSKKNAPLFVRLLLPTFLRGADKDKSAMEVAVEASGLDWTILRPAILTDDVATGHVRVLQEGTLEKVHKITREDVASFLVDQLSSKVYSNRFLTIGNVE